MNKVKVFTCHHKPSAFLSSPAIIPIHVGKINSISEICTFGDDTGDNISYKNPFYCELTAHYWVWKNEALSEFVGFMHYRRHFNFSEDQKKEEDIWGMVNRPEINAEYESEFGLDEDSILKIAQSYDILVPKKWSVKAAGSKNNYHHYKVSDHLHIKDYQAAIDIILEKYPDYYKAVKKFNEGHDGYYTNMFVMKKELFQEYSEWLFDVLTSLEKELSFENYSAQEKRVFGHISERLFNIFIEYKLSSTELKIKELQRTFVQKETFNAKIEPIYEKNVVPVVICSDDNYAMSLGALINSILKNSTSNKNYDILVIDNGLSLRSKQRLLNLCSGYKNVSIRFFNVNAFDEIKGAYIRPPFTIATYSRLFIPKLFENYGKVLFIDTDTVVESDVAELLDIDLGENLVAAVQDIVMEGFVKFGTVAQIEGSVLTAGEYLKEKLLLNTPSEYFQGGIMVFNVSKISEERIFPLLMKELKEGCYWFLDQDIMNKVFHGRVHYLPLEWNVYHGNGYTDVFYPNLSFSTYSRYLKARIQPKMIHFAGENKPWNTDGVDFYDNFIKNVHNTPWEREIYQRLASNASHSLPALITNKPLLFQTKIKMRLMPYLDKYAPRGSKRRSNFAKVYYKFRRKILG
ncbi:DUF4422 domain-containing protein [Pantoea ananatis]|uniref:DUF4422 domain-containing protein n=2 Tax=Pantoea ananas TaxID=553 RepID=A0A8A4KC27_PANAN|nr:DUF4422 domain-containing protein [Pantoea ananatis]AVG77533.1 DUF4422 domain-containing protein [Pantoea ananatis]MDI6536217.1 DUF4422 domain-containing protein [Pantoea ananatis]MDN4126916.1 DUF4422 domain-containing protein [Pantoea ananatis]MDN4151414.1 DUF4422 domain-containing protein [Pantoea ananatis]PQK88450.1 glycosyl transferase [Pantoea ananatis]